MLDSFELQISTASAQTARAVLFEALIDALDRADPDVSQALSCAYAIQELEQPNA